MSEQRVEFPPRSLRDFTREAWPIVEPARELRETKAFGRLYTALEAYTLGQPVCKSHPVLRGLVITGEGATMKSLMVSVMWQAWVWTFRRSSRWLFNSYSQRLAERDAVRTYQIVRSSYYREEYELAVKAATSPGSYFDNSQGGYRASAGLDGGTGGRGDFVVSDELVAALEARPQVVESAVRAWAENWSPRGMRGEFGEARRVIIAPDDVGEYVAGLFGYELLALEPEEWR
jgi:hypothetical protein